MDELARELLEAGIRERAQAQDYEAATQLAIEGYGPELMRFVSAVISSSLARPRARFDRVPSDADDVFAEACADIWRGLPGFAWQSSFRTWAFRITRHACYRHLRSPQRRRQFQQTSGALEQIVQSVRTVTRQHLLTETKTRLTRLRDSLSLEEQSLLTLRVDRGLEWGEIAEVLAESILDAPALKRAAASWRKRFERLTDKLRELARAEGLVGDD